jgi:hypothetical protein
MRNRYTLAVQAADLEHDRRAAEREVSERYRLDMLAIRGPSATTRRRSPASNADCIFRTVATLAMLLAGVLAVVVCIAYLDFS